MITVEIPAILRQMIDARLDNIERALLTKGMARGDRRQVLSGIEDQILEMLDQSTNEEPTREDLLNILARLDPPEAYLDVSGTEFEEFSPLKTGDLRLGAAVPRSNVAKGDINVLAVIAFVLTCLAVLCACSWWMLGWFGLIPLGVATIGAGVCGTISMYQFIVNRSNQRGLWMAVTATACTPAAAVLSWVAFLILEA